MNRSFAVIASLVATAALIAALVFALRPQPASLAATGESGMVMKVYQVAVDQAEDIRNSLRTVLFSNSQHREPIGHASLPMPGQLVVLAPGDLHPSIEATIRALEQSPAAAPTATSPGQVRLHMWVVEAVDEPGEEGQVEMVRRALEPLRASMAHAQFRTISHGFAAARTDGRRFTLSSGPVEGTVAVRPTHDGLHVSLFAELPRSHFNSEVVLPIGVPQAVALISRQRQQVPDAPDLILVLLAQNIVD